MIRTVIFDLENVLALEGPPGNLTPNPAFTSDFDRLYEEGYDVLIIARKSADLLNTTKAHFTEFYKSTIVHFENECITKSSARGHLQDLLEQHSLLPSEVHYFYDTSELEDEDQEKVFQMLTNEIALNSVFGYGPSDRIGHWIIPQCFLEKFFYPEARSEKVSISAQEQKLSGELLSLISLRMCRLLNEESEYEDFVEVLAYSLCRTRGLDPRRTSKDFARCVRDLGSLGQYDRKQQLQAAKGALMDHHYISANERSVACLDLWKVIKDHGPHIFEMTVDAADLHSGDSPLLKHGNRKCFAYAVESFFDLEGQDGWGFEDRSSPQFREILVPQEVVNSFIATGLVVKSRDGLIWSRKMEPYFAHSSGQPEGYDKRKKHRKLEAEEFFQYACGHKSWKDWRM